ncbi:hypothetical protein THAOC_25210 [Thalassiosira oceanica]|uniref:Uncharacterized protein n=1 Tax=Thalassiosira oceanica TaxID=159749 RepID=K0S8I1_THAOC|nr:hypothetical protein THAOC_25210 [Thalassiosira oceanica]|eukprot:EJK55092.1 hypothetical protein THAOC_25210 [Thalassiosira oceanica]
MCAPEGVPSGHEEGEARQLKTNPFPTQSYPTRKRQVQPISSNKPRDGRVGEKFVTSNAAMGSKANKNPLQDKNIDPAHIRGMDSSGLGDHRSAIGSTFRLPVMDQWP